MLPIPRSIPPGPSIDVYAGNGRSNRISFPAPRVGVIPAIAGQQPVTWPNSNSSYFDSHFGPTIGGMIAGVTNAFIGHGPLHGEL